MAAVDVGSNTLHLLVATLTPEGFRDRVHAVEMLGLGRQVASRARLGRALIDRSARLVAELVALAQAQGAESVSLVATEAVRGASDAGDLVEAVQVRSGGSLKVLSGEEEARLSYLGATAFRVPPGQPALVADIGGGSTEVVQGQGTRPGRGVSLKLGSDQLLRLVQASDPPTERERVHAAARVSMVLELAPQEGQPELLLATGGSAASLPALLGRRAAPEEVGAQARPETGEDWMEVSRADLEEALQLVLSVPSRELAARTGLARQRARLMAGGVLILVGLLDCYRAPGLTVTERGLRDGVLLALAAG